MFTARSIVQAIFGFILPIVLGTFLAPYIFTDGVSKSIANASARKTSEKNLSLTNEVAEEAIHNNQSFYAKVKSDELINPTPDKFYILSTVVRFDKLPDAEKHENLIAKYEAKTFPYQGIALAVHRYKTSIRPAVYWKDEKGKGGWFTFNDVNFTKKSYYALTLIAKEGDFVQLYVEELNNLANKELFTAKTNTTENKDGLFKGAYSIAGIQSPSNTSSLNFGTYKEDFSAFVSNLLIAKKSKLSLDSLEKFIKGGPEAIASTLSQDEISLWIKDGEDLSTSKRSLIFPENAAS